MAHDGNAKIEEMDDGEATSIDMPETVGRDMMFPMAYSSDAEKEQENADLVGVIRQSLQKVPFGHPSDCNIFRIPAFVLEENPAAYIPHIVSIGPFHHDQKHLQPMEARKMKYLHDFLCRKSQKELKDYVKAITDLVERANRCYSEIQPQRKNLVMMMVVDGCFILELLLREPDTKSDLKWILLVLSDLVLLENQLPFIVLEALYKVFNEDSAHEVVDTRNLITSLMCKNFVPHILRLLLGDVEMNSPEDIELIEPKHLLDLVVQFLKPRIWQPLEKRIEETSVGRARNCLRFAPECVCKLRRGDPLEQDNLIVRTRCATELEKAGVKFKKNKKPKSLLDIEFDRANGVLTIPGINIGYESELILRNLLVYEQNTDDYNYITEYAAFLGDLIKTGKDVELLQKSGIIENIFGDPNEVARLFNNLLKDVVIPFSYTIKVRHAVEQYYNIPWHNWKANLMLNYFNAPSSFISFVAATILLILTFTQTFYSAKPYIG